MKIVFMGTPEFAVPSLRAVAEKHDVLLCIVQPDRQAGRGRKPKPPAVKIAAEQLGISVYQPENVSDEEPVAKLIALKPDFIIVVAYGQILKKRVLNIPTICCLNLHGSILPKLRGAAPMQRAIMNGHGVTGVTTMKIARKMDAGDMLLKENMAITATTTTGDIHDELSSRGAKLMLRTIDELAEGSLVGEPQNEAEATYAAKIEPSERCINWNSTAVEIDRQIRGLSPSPASYTIIKGRRIILLRCQLMDGEAKQPAGTINIEGKLLAIDTGSGRLSLLEVKPEGKRATSAMEWARGARLMPEDKFEGLQNQISSKEAK